jgi:hypothetical protein
MQQRRLRLGDILDDYCPRERRVTNHAVVAMIDDDIRQTRCTTCDTEHEYKQGKAPTLRRKKEPVAAAYKEVLAAVSGEPQATTGPQASEPVQPPLSIAGPAVEGQPASAPEEAEPVLQDAAGADRLHRRLIRATLPRPENHQVVRPVPEFTMRQPTARPGKFRGGMRGNAVSRPGGRVGAGGNTRSPIFGRPTNGRGGANQGGRPVGRPDPNRPSRGGQPARHGKKHSK